MGLAVNGEKTKLMVSTLKTSSRLGPTVELENYSFEVVKNFIYLGTAINKTNDIRFEIQRRIVMADRCYYGLSKQFRNKATSRQTKLTIYKTLVLPMLLYGSRVFKRKILRKIYGPICVDGEIRRPKNH